MRDAIPSPSPPQPIRTTGVSELPFDRHGHDVNDPGCRELLAMHEVWRRLERGAIASGSIRRAALAVTAIPL